MSSKMKSASKAVKKSKKKKKPVTRAEQYGNPKSAAQYKPSFNTPEQSREKQNDQKQSETKPNNNQSDLLGQKLMDLRVANGVLVDAEEDDRANREFEREEVIPRVQKRFQSDKKSAVFLDLDGTLWDREQVPDSAWDAIRKARQNGHLIFINTGRTPDAIPEFLWDADLDGYSLSTGMTLYGKGRKLLKQHFMDPKKVHEMEDFLKSVYSGYSLEQNTVAFDDPKYAFRRKIYFDKSERKEIMHRLALHHMKPEDYDSIVKIIFDSEKTFDLETQAHKLGYDMLLYTNRFNAEGTGSGVFRGELTDRSRDKAGSMDELLAALGKKKGEYRTIAIGDSSNDIPMIQMADIGIAMGNGSDEVKACANFETHALHEDGLEFAFACMNLI